MQQSFLQIVVVPQATPQQKDTSIRAAARNENSRVFVTEWIRQEVLFNEMCFGVDRNWRHDPHVSEDHLALGIEQRDKIQTADIPRQAQLQRPAQISLAVADALGRLVDKNCADLSHVGAGHLQVDECEDGGRRY